MHETSRNSMASSLDNGATVTELCLIECRNLLPGRHKSSGIDTGGEQKEEATLSN